MSVIEKIKNAKGPLFTFELLPPLKGHSIDRIYKTIDRLIEFQPAYINFTSHRNETTFKERPDGLIEKRVTRIRPGTIALAAAVKYKYNITVVPHILCGGFTKEETENVLIEMNFLGIDDVLALRGDPQRGNRSFIAEKDGHTHTFELVRQIVDMNNGRYLEESLEDTSPTNFCIGVAGYPEKHFEAPNLKTDVKFVKEKVDAGADYVVTQMFYDNKYYFKFVELCKEVGINVPIIPGLKIITSRANLTSVPKNFYINIPDELTDEVMAAKPENVLDIGVEWAAKQVEELLNKNVPSVHFYIMQNSKPIIKLMERLKL